MAVRFVSNSKVPTVAVAKLKALRSFLSETQNQGFPRQNPLVLFARVYLQFFKISSSVSCYIEFEIAYSIEILILQHLGGLPYDVFEEDLRRFCEYIEVT
ncbi:hypothetical protein DITRI_Ditri09bG0019100 [Diplodiscus trichospermus]